MKFPKTGRLLIPSLIFVVAAAIIMSGLFGKAVSSDPHQNINDTIFFYTTNIIFWLVAAFILNQISQIFLWGGIFKRPVSSGWYKMFVDFFSTLIYVAAISFIIIAVFNQELTTGWIVILLAVLFVGSVARSSILSYFSKSVFSSSRTFNIGDWIQILSKEGNEIITGEVFDIDRHTTKIKDESNNLVLFPNDLISEVVVKNYWGLGKETMFECSFVIDFSVPIDRVKRVIIAGAKQALFEKGLLQVPEPSVLVENITDRGITYNLRYWIIPWQDISPREAADKIFSNVVRHLQRTGLSLAYNKSDIFYAQMPERQTNLDSINDRKTILSNIDIFSALNESEINLLGTEIQQRRFKKNTVVITQGDDGDSMFVLVEGLLKVSIKTEDGTTIDAAQITPGDFFGEMSLLTGEKRSATITALTDTVMFEISKSSIEKIIGTRKEIVEELGRELLKRTETNAELISRLKTPKHTFANLVKNIRKFFNVN